MRQLLVIMVGVFAGAAIGFVIGYKQGERESTYVEKQVIPLSTPPGNYVRVCRQYLREELCWFAPAPK